MGRNSLCVLLALLVCTLSCSPQQQQKEPPLTPEGKEYARSHLQLSDVGMKAADSYAKQTLTEIEGRKIPTAWHIAIPRLTLAIDCTPLNARSWMGTNFPYWEGPISFGGSHSGLGYLEMTGY